MRGEEKKEEQKGQSIMSVFRLWHGFWLSSSDISYLSDRFRLFRFRATVSYCCVSFHLARLVFHLARFHRSWGRLVWLRIHSLWPLIYLFGCKLLLFLGLLLTSVGGRAENTFLALKVHWLESLASFSHRCFFILCCLEIFEGWIRIVEAFLVWCTEVCYLVWLQLLCFSFILVLVAILPLLVQLLLISCQYVC